MTDWESSNPPPTHQSMNPARLLKILMVSTWQVERVGQVDKFKRKLYFTTLNYISDYTLYSKLFEISQYIEAGSSD